MVLTLQDLGKEEVEEGVHGSVAIIEVEAKEEMLEVVSMVILTPTSKDGNQEDQEEEDKAYFGGYPKQCVCKILQGVG